MPSSKRSTCFLHFFLLSLVLIHNVCPVFHFTCRHAKYACGLRIKSDFYHAGYKFCLNWKEKKSDNAAYRVNACPFWDPHRTMCGKVRSLKCYIRWRKWSLYGQVTRSDWARITDANNLCIFTIIIIIIIITMGTGNKAVGAWSWPPIFM